MVRLFLVDHYYRLGRWLLLLRWHRLSPMVQRYLEHPKFPMGRWLLWLHLLPPFHLALLFPKVREHLDFHSDQPFRMVQRYLEGHYFRMDPLLRLHRRLPQFPKALRFLVGRINRRVLLLLWLHLHRPFHLVRQYLVGHLDRLGLLPLLPHSLRRLPKDLPFRSGREHLRFHLDLPFPMVPLYLVAHSFHLVR